jgi:hypothetical protein
MAFREVSVVQVKEALRRWLKGEGERPIGRGVGIDRRTARRDITAAVELGVDRDGGEEQLTDELIGQVVERVRPHRPDGHGEAWRTLLAEEDRIKSWVKADLTVVKIGILLARRGVRSIVVEAENTAPRFNDVFFEYAQSRGFAVDAARVATPTDKPRVERTVPYVRNNFFAGETFVDLADVRMRAETWCVTTAGMRVHGSTQCRPAEAFRAEELTLLLAHPGAPFDTPRWSEPKVARDYHVEVDKALYSAPHRLIGHHVKARRDSTTVKLYFRGELVKLHPARLRANAPPTRPTTQQARRSTPPATSTGSGASPPTTARPSASTPRRCWTRRCRGPRCARSIGSLGW